MADNTALKRSKMPGISAVSGLQKTQAKDAGNDRVIALLEMLGARLIASEKERAAVQDTLTEHREMFADLEDKAMLTEKAYISMQNQIAKREALEKKILAGQEALQKGLDEKMAKIEKAAALADRFDELLARQERLARRLEKVGKERLVLTQKLDRIEDSVSETQDAMHKSARWMLAGKDPANESGKTDDSHTEKQKAEKQKTDDKASVPLSLQKDHDNDNAGGDLPWWKNSSFRAQAAAMAMVILLAGLIGGAGGAFYSGVLSVEGVKNGVSALWGHGDKAMTVAALSAPPVPPASGATEPEDRRIYASLDGDQVFTDITAESLAALEPAVGGAMTGNLEAGTDILKASDEVKLAAFEQDPRALGEKLNEIEPQNIPPVAEEESAVMVEEARSAPQKEETARVASSSVPGKIFASVPAFLDSQTSATPLADRIPRDDSLPAVIREIEDKAFNGRAEAQHDLAAIYTAGHGGVTVDYAKATHWFREAGLQGVANARYNLGVLYHQGLGVPRDVDLALNWYRAAAYLEHPEAQYNLGIAYIEGIGTDYDPLIAAQLFERAAQGGIMEAAYNLGLIWENGLLGDPDYQAALRWYKQAADAGSAEAQKAFDQLSETAPQALSGVNNNEEAVSYAKPLRTADALPDVDAATYERGEPQNIQTMRAMTAQIQEQLIRQGLYPGPADGLRGPVTADAIRSYQKQYALPQTGEVSEALLVHMMTADLASSEGDLGSRAE